MAKTQKKEQFCLVFSKKHFFSPLSIFFFLTVWLLLLLKNNPQSYMVLTCWLLHAFVLRSLCRQQPRSSSEGAGLGVWLQEGGRVCQEVQVCLCCTLEPLRPKKKALLNLLYLIVIVFVWLYLYVCLVSRSLLEGNEYFEVPEVIDELSGSRVLAMDLIQGVPLDRCVDLDQETRNQVQLDAVVPHYVALF